MAGIIDLNSPVVDYVLLRETQNMCFLNVFSLLARITRNQHEAVKVHQCIIFITKLFIAFNHILTTRQTKD